MNWVYLYDSVKFGIHSISKRSYFRLKWSFCSKLRKAGKEKPIFSPLSFSQDVNQTNSNIDVSLCVNDGSQWITCNWFAAGYQMAKCFTIRQAKTRISTFFSWESHEFVCTLIVYILLNYKLCVKQSVSTFCRPSKRILLFFLDLNFLLTEK